MSEHPPEKKALEKAEATLSGLADIKARLQQEMNKGNDEPVPVPVEEAPAPPPEIDPLPDAAAEKELMHFKTEVEQEWQKVRHADDSKKMFEFSKWLLQKATEKGNDPQSEKLEAIFIDYARLISEAVNRIWDFIEGAVTDKAREFEMLVSGVKKHNGLLLYHEESNKYELISAEEIQSRYSSILSAFHTLSPDEKESFFHSGNSASMLESLPDEVGIRNAALNSLKREWESEKKQIAASEEGIKNEQTESELKLNTFVSEIEAIKERIKKLPDNNGELISVIKEIESKSDELLLKTELKEEKQRIIQEALDVAYAKADSIREKIEVEPHGSLAEALEAMRKYGGIISKRRPPSSFSTADDQDVKIKELIKPFDELLPTEESVSQAERMLGTRGYLAEITHAANLRELVRTYCEEKINEVRESLAPAKEQDLSLTKEDWIKMAEEFKDNTVYRKKQIEKILTIKEADEEMRSLKEEAEDWKRQLNEERAKPEFVEEMEKVVHGHLADLKSVFDLIAEKKREIQQKASEEEQRLNPKGETPEAKKARFEEKAKLHEQKPETPQEERKRLEGEAKIKKNIEDQMVDVGAEEFLTKDGKAQFDLLSPGQQLQLLDQFRNRMFGHVQNEARKKHESIVEQNGKIKGWFQRRLAVSKTIFKENKIKGHERNIGREMLDGKTEEARKTKATMLAELMGSIKQTEDIYGLKVHADGENLDKYRVEYVSAQQEGNDQINPDVLMRFNRAATNFSRLPTEADMDAAGISGGDRKLYRKQKEEYEQARKEILNELEFAKEKEHGALISQIEHNPELSQNEKTARINNIMNRSALLEGNAIDARVKMSQFMNVHPEVASELEKLREDAGFWKSVGGAFFAGKNSKDIRTLFSIAGTTAGVRKLAKAATWNNPLTAGIIGGVAGGFRGWFRGGKMLREREEAMRRGKQFDDKREVEGYFADGRKKPGFGHGAKEIGKSLKDISYSDKSFIKATKDGYAKKINELSKLVGISFTNFEKSEDNKKIAEVFVKNENDRLRSTQNAESDRLSRALRTGAITKNVYREAKRAALEQYQKEQLTGVDERTLERMKLGWTEKLETRLEFMRTKMEQGLVNFGEGKDRRDNELSMLQAIAGAQVSLAGEFSSDKYAALGKEYMIRTQNEQREKRLQEKFEEKDARVARRQTLYKTGQAAFGATVGVIAGEIGYHAQPWLGRQLHSIGEGLYRSYQNGVSGVEHMFSKTIANEIINNAKDEATHSQTAQLIAAQYPLNQSDLHIMQQQAPDMMPKFEDETFPHLPENDLVSRHDIITGDSAAAPSTPALVIPHTPEISAPQPESYTDLTAHSQSDSRERLLKHYLYDMHKGKGDHFSMEKAGIQARHIMEKSFPEYKNGKEPPFFKGSTFRIYDDGNGQVHLDALLKGKLPFDGVPQSTLEAHKTIAGSAERSLNTILKDKDAGKIFGFSGNDKEFSTWSTAASRQVIKDNPWIRSIVTHDGNDLHLRRGTDGTWHAFVEKGNGALTPHSPRHIPVGQDTHYDLNKSHEAFDKAAAPQVPTTPEGPAVSHLNIEPYKETSLKYINEAMTRMNFNKPSDIFHGFRSLVEADGKNEMWNKMTGEMKARAYYGFFKHLAAGKLNPEFLKPMGIDNPMDIPAGKPISNLSNILTQNAEGAKDSYLENANKFFERAANTLANGMEPEIEVDRPIALVEVLNKPQNFDLFVDAVKERMKDPAVKFDMNMVDDILKHLPEQKGFVK